MTFKAPGGGRTLPKITSIFEDYKSTFTKLRWFGDVKKAQYLFSSKFLDNVIEDSAAQKAIAQAIKRSIKRVIEKGDSAFPRLHPFTADRKGSKKTLLETQQLLKAIRVIRDGATITVGVRRGDKVEGRAIGNEFGRTIRLNEQKRRMFHAMGLHLQASTRYLRIPARPFIRTGVARVYNHLGSIGQTAFDASVKKTLKRF